MGLMAMAASLPLHARLVRLVTAHDVQAKKKLMADLVKFSRGSVEDQLGPNGEVGLTEIITNLGCLGQRTALEGHLIRNLMKAYRFPAQQDEAADSIKDHYGHLDKADPEKIDQQIRKAADDLVATVKKKRDEQKAAEMLPPASKLAKNG